MRKIEIPDESSALRHEEIAAGETPTPNIEEVIAEDGILCLILSFLNLKEAVRTSVLSSRWRHIWTHLTIFNFNPISVLDAPTLQSGDPGSIETYETYNLTKGKADKFIQIVDSTVQQLQGVRLDEFAVRYFLDKSHSHHLDTWVSFAVASQTKLLALHLFESHVDSSIKPYDFPCHLLKSSRSIEMADLPKGSCMFIHLRHLDLQLDDSTKMGLLDVATLMDAAPFLEELKLCLSQRVLGRPPRRTPEKFRKMLPKHSHLKKIEVSGFYFETWQIEIAIYLLNNATELESMMIEKGSTLSEEVLQRRTEILAREVPVKVKLVVF